MEIILRKGNYSTVVGIQSVISALPGRKSR